MRAAPDQELHWIRDMPPTTRAHFASGSRHLRFACIAIGVFMAGSQIGCIETETGTGLGTPNVVVVVPPDPFPINVSPGVAPGEADGCAEDFAVPGRLLGRVYDIPLETRLLPDFEAMSPVETVCLDRLDVTPRRSVYPGFPGLRDRFRWFAVDLGGVFDVQDPGPYQFRLTSDDGAQFYVDDALVIDNDGYHPTRMATGGAQLSPGQHAVRVGYWQGPGPMALVLEVARPGEAYRVFRMDRAL